MHRTALENIRLRQVLTILLLCLCVSIPAFYWAHVLDIGMLHVNGHGVLIGAFLFSLASLIFVFFMEVLSIRALIVKEKLLAVQSDRPDGPARAVRVDLGKGRIHDACSTAPSGPGRDPEGQQLAPEHRNLNETRPMQWEAAHTGAGHGGG